MAGEQLQIAIDSYAQQLWSHRLPWHDWFERRGLTPATVSRHKLGYVGQPRSDHVKFVGSICIPYFSGLGAPVALRFRHPDGHKPKYTQPFDQPALIYGVDQVENRKVCITEGEMDALVLRQLGYPAVGIPGAKTFKGHPEWRYLFRDCSRVLICFDGDDEGRRYGDQIARMLHEMTRVSVVALPDGKDVTDAYVAGGPDAVKSMLDRAGY